MVCGRQAQDFKVGPGGTLCPHWAGIQTANNGSFDGPFAWTNILPGDTKISLKWKSKEIKNAMVLPDAMRHQWILPIMQVYTYFVKANACYGYIITDKELVVLRIRPNENAEKMKGPRTYTPKEATESDDIPGYTSISWESGDQLLVNLALWWLHLLAASNSSIEWDYPPLAEETLKPSDQTGNKGQEEGQESEDRPRRRGPRKNS
ncbi:uncharacterized protein K441DRAFT_671097 [Cenococcum geophilum 1.58]|uniref:Uncharacterized protein n=1 Tax=Cenococcum geophilum 1.58 TaxID=794803 RepID=A0ACC8EM96_9PEZI|nr:hypothetical protein K441DRAFT_671097 [Cenococcum geophilum 1.58]